MRGKPRPMDAPTLSFILSPCQGEETFSLSVTLNAVKGLFSP